MLVNEKILRPIFKADQAFPNASTTSSKNHIAGLARVWRGSSASLYQDLELFTKIWMNLRNLEFEVDAAFKQPGILIDLQSSCTIRTLEYVAGVQNGLDLSFTRHHSPSRQGLCKCQTERRIVIFGGSIVCIQTRGGKVWNPPVHGRQLGLGGIHLGFETSGHQVETLREQLILDIGWRIDRMRSQT